MIPRRGRQWLNFFPLIWWANLGGRSRQIESLVVGVHLVEAAPLQKILDIADDGSDVPGNKERVTTGKRVSKDGHASDGVALWQEWQQSRPSKITSDPSNRGAPELRSRSRDLKKQITQKVSWEVFFFFSSSFCHEDYVFDLRKLEK